jgi:hypothetical protein
LVVVSRIVLGVAHPICPRCAGLIESTVTAKTVAGLAYHPDCWDLKMRAQRRSAGSVPEAVIRTRLQTLIQSGALPSEIPTSIAAVANAPGHVCTACEATIEDTQLQFEVTARPGVVLYLHRRCLALWVNERQGNG